MEGVNTKWTFSYLLRSVIHNNLRESLQIILLLIAVVALLWWIIQIYCWWDSIRPENYVSQLTHSQRILFSLSHSQHISRQHASSMRLMSNCNLQEPKCQVQGTIDRLKHHSWEQRWRDPSVSLPTSLRPSRVIMNARADRRTLAMMGWRRAESCTGKGQQGQERRREVGSEGTWGKATEIWKARLFYRWHQVVIRTGHILCKKKTLSIFWVRHCILAPSFQLCDCRRSPWWHSSLTTLRAASLVLHDTWVTSSRPVPAACYLFNMTDTQKIE